MYKLLILDMNTWNYATMWKLFLLGIFDIITMCKQMFIEEFKKSAILKKSNGLFRNEWNFKIK